MIRNRERLAYFVSTRIWHTLRTVVVPVGTYPSLTLFPSLSLFPSSTETQTTELYPSDTLYLSDTLYPAE